MTEKQERTEVGEFVVKENAEGFNPGQAPLKVITGTQTTRNLNFELKPGAIVAHPNSSVIFVCG
jgi:hypothetical protein